MVGDIFVLKKNMGVSQHGDTPYGKLNRENME